ncbi:MAG: tetratricopeptide repeat protein [Deltaproteobacteria bacterium]|nr:tetratricopeptide repeat protein [Deltaproteobacteria bacterium]
MLKRPLGAALALCLSVSCRESTPTHIPPRDTGPPTASAGPALTPVRGDSAVDLQIRLAQARCTANPGQGRRWLELAQAFIRKARETADPGFYLQAEDAVARALRIDPADLNAVQMQGLIMMQDHRFREVRELAQRSLARNSQAAILHGLLGDAEMEVGHYTQAEESYQRMLDLRPNLPSYSRASWMRWLLGDAEGAIDLARRAVEAGDPRVPEEHAWTMVQLANLYFATGDVQHALENCNAALITFARYPAALATRGLIRRARGDLTGAVEDLAIAVEGNGSTEHLMYLGEAQEAAGRNADAQATYTRLERIGRRSDPRTLALFYANHDREHDAAVSLARRELDNRPDDVYTQDVLAWALYRAGNLPEAARYTDLSRRIHTADARFAYHAGMIALASGQREAAATLLRDALRYNPHFDERLAEACRQTLAGLPGGLGDAGAAPAPRADAGAGAAPRRP